MDPQSSLLRKCGVRVAWLQVWDLFLIVGCLIGEPLPDSAVTSE